MKNEPSVSLVLSDSKSAPFGATLPYGLIMQSSSIEHIPGSARSAITHYEHLRVGQGKTVRCPYYRNPHSNAQRWGLNAFSGKGSAEEIEEELKIIQKLEGKDFSQIPEEQIRDIMRKRRIGIECSGFVAHVLDAWVWGEKGKHIFNVISFSSRGLVGRIAAWLRPFTHIDVATLVDSRNAQEFFTMQEFRPGDLLYFQASEKKAKREGADQLRASREIDHIALVTGVERDEKKLMRKIWYAHSVREDSGVGVKEGIITVFDLRLPLVEQEWREAPETGQTIEMRATREDFQASIRFFHPLFLQ